jgi:hypothetical protein
LFLGGGGYLELAAYYELGGGLSSRLQIGITAGASVALNIGVARGSVAFFVGIEVNWYAASAGGSHVSVVLRVVLTGEVVVLAIISVSLLLALEAAYSDGTLECTGILALSIKICWCFTITVRQRVHFTLGHGRSTGGLGAMDQALDHDELLAEGSSRPPLFLEAAAVALTTGVVPGQLPPAAPAQERPVQPADFVDFNFIEKVVVRYFHSFGA